MSRSVITKIVCLALAGSVLTTIPVGEANAARKTLLEQWFPKAAQRMKNKQRPQLIIQQRQNPAASAIKKVEGPSYYVYKTEGIKTLVLAGLLPVLAPKVVIEKIEPVKDVKPKTAPVTSVEESKPAGDVVIDPSSTGSTKAADKYRGFVVAPHAITNASIDGLSFKLEDQIAAAIKDHYSKDPSFLWVDRNWKINTNGQAVLKVLENAGEVGLDREDYLVDKTELELADSQNAEKRAARFEISLSAALVRYGADAQSGRVNPNGISGYHDFPKYNRNYRKVLSQIVESDNPAGTLVGFNPQNSKFAMLVSELAELRASIDEDSIEPIKPGTFFKPGQESSELPKIVAMIGKKASPELKLSHQEAFNNYDGALLFSENLVALVKDFQKENGLGPDGIVGKNTIAKLQTASPKAKIDKIELAMERLRWLPENFGQRHVFINQPAYSASYMVDDKTSLSMRAIVGKPTNQTYFFYDKIEVVEVNPYWNVPYSILVNQKLGKIRANPGYLTANGFEVMTASGITDPYSVDWYSGAPNGVSIRQKPGSGNALGELKILFPNKHAIYMHDTPERGLFSRESRAYSSGCIRLQHPREMAAAVLQTSVSQVSSYVNAGENRTLKVSNQIPVYVSYFTAWPNDDGKVGFYADIYGRDKALLQAIEKTKALRSEIGAVSS